MVFHYYAPATKVAVIRMAHQNYSLDNIRRALGEQFSTQSFKRWNQLYSLTQRVIRDPAQYDPRGAVSQLTTEDRAFMLELIRTQPGLFLDKIRKRLYDKSGVLLSESAIHWNLVDKMEITLKKANTVNIQNSLQEKFAWVEKMDTVPAKFLVFTGV